MNNYSLHFLSSFIFCGLSSSTAFAVLDVDNDGMSDVWQHVHSIANGDTASDPDKDGFTNIEEARVGTDPHDVNDYFKLTNYTISPTLDTADFTWRSLEDRSYNIEGSKDLISWDSMENMRGIQGLHSSNTLNIPVSPINDNFESRLPTATDAIQATGNNENATVQAGEADNPTVSGDNSVWWTWKPTVAGDVTITTDGSNFDTTLAIYSGSDLNSLVLIGSDDDGGSGTRSSITFTADPNVVYSIQVNGYSNNTGNIVLNHPNSAGTFDAPVAGKTKPPKMFFRVKGNRFSDLDTDGDELVTWEERLLGTNDTLSDTDGDKMTDSFEFIHGFDPLSPADGVTDADGDGISNADEETAGTDPNNPDSDDNGVNDGDEDYDSDGLLNKDELAIHHTSIFDPDTDNDRMPDGWEVTHSLDPNVNDANADPDADNVNNLNEYVLDLDPNNAMSMALTNDDVLDRDSDGMPDSWEVLWVTWSRTPNTFTANHTIYGMEVFAKRLDWIIDDASEDRDYDTLTNLAEYTALTNPFQHDTDGDGLSDGWEIEHGFDPKVDNTTDSDPNNDPDADPDNDGLTNEEESTLNTDPNDPDSDGDGVSDGDEDDQGSNPNDPNDDAPPPAGTVRVDITFGDPSGSHSEKYRVTLTPLAGDTTGHGVRFRTNRRYGQPQTDTFHLPIGAQYKVELMHIGTDPDYNGDPKPDYDYVFTVDSASCLGVIDPEGLLGNHNEGDPFFAIGKSATFNTSPVFLTLNNTPEQADDLIAVSKGVDEDLATDITVQANGFGAVTADLSLKNADGDIKFKDTTLNMADSTPATTKLWGITPSSAQNKTIIVVKFKNSSGDEICSVEHEVTVFKGIKIEFDGTFVANVDSRSEGWRPNATDNPIETPQDVNDYSSKIKFQDDDQGGLRRSWTAAPEVLIRKVETIEPHMVLTKSNDVLHESEISMLTGRFEPGVVNARVNEHIYDFKIEFRESKTGDKYGNGEVDNLNATKHYKRPGVDFPTAPMGWNSYDQINESINIGHGGSPFDIRAYYTDQQWGSIIKFLKPRQQWKNEHLVFSKSANIQKSVAMKGIIGAQELKTTPKTAIRMDLERFNIWYLNGDIKAGIITTDTLP